MAAMANPNVKLFLSCVSDEFGVDREALRHHLTGLTIEVKVQEDFIALGFDTLSKLDSYVGQCDVVVHLVGDMVGSAPPSQSVAEFLQRRPDLKSRLPSLAPLIDAEEAIPYTHWEAWLSLYHRRPLLIAAPETETPRGPNFHPTSKSKALQAAHLERLRQLARYPEVKFGNRDRLVNGILSTLFALYPDASNPISREKQRLARPRVYVERQSLMSEIVSSLNTAISSSAPTAVVLLGPPGCGKSTLAEDICDLVPSTVHRITADNEPDLHSIRQGDLVLVDGLMNNRTRDQAETWLMNINVKYIVVATRLQEAIYALQTAYPSIMIHEIAISGLTRDEFFDCVKLCGQQPGYAPIQFNDDQLNMLYERTSGLPLAIKLISRLLSSPTANKRSLTFPSTTSPSKMLDVLIKSWREQISQEDRDLEEILFVMSNIPSIGMSADAIAFILGWKCDIVMPFLVKLWDEGLLSRISNDDDALHLHDAIGRCFRAADTETERIKELRVRYCGYCSEYSSDKSALSMTDSLLFNSEYLFGHVRREVFPHLASATYAVILELDQLQKNVMDVAVDTDQKLRFLATWIANHIDKNSSCMTCSEVIALAGLSLKLPIISNKLANAFAVFWQNGKEHDPTKISCALVASMYHWRDNFEQDKYTYLSKLERAVDRQNWQKFGGASDIVAAGFGAAYAILNAHTVGAGIVSGYRIRGKISRISKRSLSCCCPLTRKIK